MEKLKKEKNIGRVGLLFLIFFIISILIIGKVISIQWVEGEEWRSKAKGRSFSKKIIKPIRGNILAENGDLISTNKPLFDLFMDIDNIDLKVLTKDIDSLDLLMHNYFELNKNKDKVKENITSKHKNKEKGRRNYLLKSNVSYEKMQLAKKFPILREKGVLHIREKGKRTKPFGRLASRTIGFVNKEGDIKYVGLEGAYNTLLQGKPASFQARNFSHGYWMSEDGKLKDVTGYDVVTYLDMNIQDVATSALEKQLQAQKAHHGSAVVMEVKTGKVLAIANLTRSSNGQYQEVYNYAVGESTEPGSTFKLASLIVALEDNVVDTSDIIATGNGIKRFAGKRMTDSHREGFGNISVAKCFEKSSNVGISTIINDAYEERPEKFVNRLYAMGLNTELGIEIAGEGSPLIKHPHENKSWSKISLPWMSIGYETRMTPLQILTFYNGIANNGVMMKPQFVKEISKNGQTVKKIEPVILNEKLCSQKTINIMKALMEGVVKRGTASNLRTSKYQIAGKTGTAQVAQGSSGYNKKDYSASFVGYFPADNPKYSCIVVINKPSQGRYYGGDVAGEVFKSIADRLYATRLNIEDKNDATKKIKSLPELQKGKINDIEQICQFLSIPFEKENTKDEWVIAKSEEGERFRLTNFENKKGIVPNLKGMNLKDAAYILESAGLKFNVRGGKGHVKRQSISPGKSIKQGRKITLTLS